MIISVITPTCDRPAGIALAERFMARQTVKPDQWIVADGGQTAARLNAGQAHIWQPAPRGPENFGNNLLAGLAMATGDAVIFVEDDDWYGPTHIESLVRAFEAAPNALLAGDDCQRYYNVEHRCWRKFSNVGASLCQTAARKAAIPSLRRVIRDCMVRGTYGIDTTLWRSIPRAQWALTRGQPTVLGIKGLPGCAGLGIGHRPTGNAWTPDPDLSTLREWIGADADLYAEYGIKRAA